MGHLPVIMNSSAVVQIECTFVYKDIIIPNHGFESKVEDNLTAFITILYPAFNRFPCWVSLFMDESECMHHLMLQGRLAQATRAKMHVLPATFHFTIGD